MSYAVKSIFLTLQGEGAQAGRPAVFLRFSGCNLWTGREQDRSDAACTFCDTDFIGTDGDNGGRFADAPALAQAVRALWPGTEHDAVKPFVVCTGGEPLLQLDASLIEALHAADFTIAVETNGTLAAPAGIDWLCVSPKADNTLVQTCGDELKLVYPQEACDPADFEHLDFGRFVLQPMDGPRRVDYTRSAIDYCLKHPRWGLSLQTHKWTGIL